jgi:cellulase/cellobiase CelA1
VSNNSDNSGMWFWIILVVGIAMLGQIISGGSSSSNSSSSSYTPSTPTATAERTYAETRFRQEGYSNAESRQAADAVMKFHEAQKNRR